MTRYDAPAALAASSPRPARRQAPGQPPRPPLARVDPHVTEIDGARLVDDYHWLRARGSADVLAYLEAENAYTEAVMAPHRGLQEGLYAEMLGRIREDDVSVPVRYGPFLYYSRTEKGKPFRIYCRKRESLAAPEEILLDLNAVAASGGHDYLDLGSLEVSPDHRYLGYSYDTSGDEAFTLVVKDLATGQLLPDRIANTYYSLAWASDSRTFFYTVLDEMRRPYKALRHRLGAAADVEVHHEADDRFFVELERSRSGEVILMTLLSSVTSEVRWLPADRPEEPFRVVAPREHEVEVYADHRGDELFLLTNREAKNFRVMKTAVGTTSAAEWQEVVPHQPDVRIEAMDLFRDRMVLVERAGGLSRVRIVPFDGGDGHVVTLPETAYSLATDANPEFDTPLYRFVYGSLVTPRTWFDYRVADRRLEVAKRDEVLGGYDPEGFTTERIWATAADGAAIPISIAYRRGLARDGRNPCLLQGYGAYGSSFDPDFSPHSVSLLERGFVVAIAHVRGGGELGEPWHEGGRMLAKKNTFTDFIAAAEHLVAEGWTAAERLAIRGGSAGGLLIAAAVTMRPDLFAAAIAKVPFVDIVNTMLDESIPLTVTEFEEWGNPRDDGYFEYMLSYSPYDNVGAHPYPHLLVTAGLNDPRVQYWEPAKWVARLRATKTGDQLLLLRTHMGAGHAGETDRYEAIRDRAFEWTFLSSRLGIGS